MQDYQMLKFRQKELNKMLKFKQKEFNQILKFKQNEKELKKKTNSETNLVKDFKIEHFKKIDSTQKEIFRRIALNKIQNKTVIIAEKQTSAIGTHGRIWYTEKEDNIAFSVYFELNCNIKNLDGLTLNIAKTITQIFLDQYNINLKIKFPNDIYYNNKKIGGILTESKVRGEIVKFVVIGIGINTNQEEFNPELKEIATSIKNEFNIKVNNENIIKNILYQIDLCFSNNILNKEEIK